MSVINFNEEKEKSCFFSVTAKYKLDNPDGVIKNDYVAFASAIYFYMTPSFYKPSMHDVMTGFWQPNSTD